MKQILEWATIYNTTQWMVGAERPRRYCVQQYISATDGSRIVDIGCGPGLAVRYLPPAVDYVGIEPNPKYVASAVRRFGDRARFICGYFDSDTARSLAPYDAVLLLGVVHHCDNETAAQLFSDIALGLRPGGRVVTLDPCFTPNQSSMARYVARSDRGKHVRSPEDYRAIAGSHLRVEASETRDWLLYIPTTVHIGVFGAP